ncbi:MAG: IPTL-CTERM sorting domain-containing protein [Acidobacteria bacterium]|nr:IPTL-CTERM sorting domain-containing protein [Acidobacteriota bacterium]
MSSHGQHDAGRGVLQAGPRNRARALARFLKRAFGAVILLTATTSTQAEGVVSDWSFRELAPANVEATPTLPDHGVYPIQLVLDDDGAEGAFGVAGATSRQFLWFERFTPLDVNFDLAEIWVLFPPDPQISIGSAIELVVYQDSNGNPADGAELLATFDETVQVADGNTFSVYTLPEPVAIRGGGDVLLGVISRYVVSGVTPVSQPAALDGTASQGRSWVATWTGDPPEPPLLPSDQSLFMIDDLVPGNWMIRGFGVAPQTLDIPTLGPWGLAALALLLAAVAWRQLRRRSGTSS